MLAWLLALALAPAYAPTLEIRSDAAMGANVLVQIELGDLEVGGATREALVYVPRGYGIDVDAPVGTFVAQARVYGHGDNGGYFQVASPAEAPGSDCTKTAHRALWRLPGYTGHPEVVVAVDEASGAAAAVASYVLRVCLPLIDGKGLTFVAIDALSIFRTPRAGGVYDWRAVFVPAEGTRGTEARARVLLPVRIRLKAKLVRRPKRTLVSISGSATEHGVPARQDVSFILQRGSSPGVFDGERGSEFLGVLGGFSTGTFAAQVRDRGGRYYRVMTNRYRYQPRQASSSACAPPVFAPGGCKGATLWTFYARSPVVEARP